MRQLEVENEVVVKFVLGLMSWNERLEVRAKIERKS